MFSHNSGEIKFSINKFEQMLKTKHTYFFDAQEFEEIIEYYLEFGEIQLSKKALFIALNQHPENLELLLLKSEHFILDEKYNDAYIVLDSILQVSPLNEEVIIQKANIESKIGNHFESINLLNIALKTSEDPIDIWNLIGMEYLLIDDYKNAKYFFKSCVLENFEDYPSLYNLLYCYEQLDLKEEAIEILNMILEENPYSEIAWHQLGCVFIKLSRFKEALSAFEFAIISDENFTGAYIEKAKLLEMKGNLNEAIENYNNALKSNDPSAYIYSKIGDCHFKLNNNKLALRFFLKAVHTDPGSEKSWNKLIDYYMNSFDFKKANYFLKKSLNINPDSIKLLKKSVIINKHFQITEKVIGAYKTMIDLGDKKWETFIEYIDSCITQTNWKKAIELTKLAITIFPDNSGLNFRLAGCYIKLGEISNSKNYLKKEKNISQLTANLIEMFPELKKL
jgi:tetratricopeptide (TPR) repeat protein